MAICNPPEEVKIPVLEPDEWILTAKSKISSRNINIDLDGIVYVVDNSNTLYCINVKGELVLELNDTRIYPGA
ncbi:MAG: hypothetical protein CVV23_00825 [Ignavibacteriae bacterium HGW-Ignavibacteriae-2]|jgi:outer membrane protein assembly factor BamB|nr:MAG: hypothetical protein CVV23_00825 [Ignavibacteriae bacterium HGW-Ignavibacteriae-2]